MGEGPSHKSVKLIYERAFFSITFRGNVSSQDPKWQNPG